MDNMNGSEQEYLDFYQKLRRTIRQHLSSRRNPDSGRSAYEILIDYLALLPDLFHLAIKLFFDKSVPAENKGALLAAIVYTVSPIDFIPDAIPVAGWVDDLVVLVVGLNKFFETESELVASAVNRHWAGDQSVFQVIKHILSIVDAAIEFLPRKLMQMIQSIFREIPRSK